MALDLTPQLHDDPWEAITAKYGSSSAVEPEVPSQHRHMLQAAPGAPLWSPQNPLFWLGVVMLATAAGAFSFGGNVRLAKTKASLNVGEG
jgi:hypothetical protein